MPQVLTFGELLEMQAIEPERVVAAAVKFNNGAVYQSFCHAAAYDDASRDAGIDTASGGTSLDRISFRKAHEPVEGFVTSNGRFVDRDEAFEIATQSRQIDPSERYFYGHHGNLASEELPDMRESTRHVLTAIVEELYGGVISVDMIWEFNTVQTHIGIVSRNTVPGELPYRLTVMEYKDGEDPLVHVDISKTEADKILKHVLVRRVVNELESITCAAVVKFH